MQGSIRSREWSKWWCFARLYDQREVCDEVGGGHGSRRGRRKGSVIFDSNAEEKTAYEKEATAINSKLSHKPSPGLHTNCCIAE